MTIANGEFKTEKGTPLHWRLYYDLGGCNYFTHKNEARGYRVSISREKNQFQAFSGLDNELGSVRVFLHEVNRQSKKQADIALGKVTNDFLQGIADKFGI